MDHGNRCGVRRAFESAGVEFLEENGWLRAGATEAATTKKDNGPKTEAAPADGDLGYGVELRTAGYSCRIPVDPTFSQVPGPALTGRVHPRSVPGPVHETENAERRWVPFVLRNKPNVRLARTSLAGPRTATCVWSALGRRSGRAGPHVACDCFSTCHSSFCEVVHGL